MVDSSTGATLATEGIRSDQGTLGRRATRALSRLSRHSQNRVAAGRTAFNILILVKSSNFGLELINREII